MSPRQLAVLAAVFLGAAAVHPAGALEIEGDWTRIQVGGIEVFADGNEGLAVDLARKITLLERTLGSFAMVEPGWSRPLRLYLFEDSERFAPYNLRGREAAGYTGSTDFAVMIALTGQVPVRRGAPNYNVPGEVLSHEYVHAFLAERAPRTPLWLNEGLAEFFRTYRFDDDRVYAGEGIAYHIWLLEKQGQYLPRARLVTRGTEDSDYHGGMITGLFYAQSWANTHWLMLEKDRRHGLLQFLRDLHDGMPELYALEQDLDAHFARQGGQLRNYITQHDLPRLTLRRKDQTAELEISEERLDRTTALIRLGELLLGGPEGTTQLSAREHFQAALELDRASVEARLGLAQAELRAADYPRARAQLEAVLDADPGHLRARAMMGVTLIRESREHAEERARDPGAPVAPELLSARSFLEPVIEAGFPYPNAYYAYAVSWLGEEDPTPGIEALQQAIDAAPWYDGGFDLLVHLYCSSGRLAEAREVFDRELRRRQLPTERYETEMTLVSAEIQRSQQLFEGGRQDEAADLLINALTPTDFVLVRDFILRQLTAIEVDIEYQRYVQVLELEHAGAHAQALRELDALIPELTHAGLVGRAPGLRAALESGLAAGL